MDVMMNTKKGRVSINLDELVQRTDLPFTTQVTSFPLCKVMDAIGGNVIRIIGPT